MSARPRWRAATTSAVLLVALAVAGCSPSSDLYGLPEATAAPSDGSGAATASDSSTCDDALVSYAPTKKLPQAGKMPSGSTMKEIQERGALRVGVSADTRLLGSRDPITGEIEGFDIDVLHEISDAIFGDPDRLQFKVITSGQRIDALTSRDVDLVARAFSMTCDRWDQIAFSAEYLHAGQKLLVPLDSEATRFEDLAGERVCAPQGTTTLTKLEQYPEVVAVPAATHTQCLVLFQQGEVDAITGDDTILAGFAAQDPYAKVVGEPISDEAYGVGVAADQVDLVRFVNGVLAARAADGTWKASYERWFSALGDVPTPPEPQYGRTP